MKSKIKRLLALVLCLTMILNGNVSLLASDEAAAEDQVVAEAVEEMMEEVAEEATEEVTEEVVEEAIEIVAEEEPEVVEEATEVLVEEETVEEVVEEEIASDPTEDTLKLQTELNGTIITMTGPKSSFPEGTDYSVSASEISEEAISDVEASLRKVELETKEKIVSYKAFDIKLIVDGKEAQPVGDVNVTFQGKEVKEQVAAAENVEVYHVDEEKQVAVEVEGDVKNNDVVMTTDHFSTYVITTKNPEGVTVTVQHYLTSTSATKTQLYRDSQERLTVDQKLEDISVAANYTVDKVVKFDGTNEIEVTGSDIILADTTYRVYYSPTTGTTTGDAQLFDYQLQGRDGGNINARSNYSDSNTSADDRRFASGVVDNPFGDQYGVSQSKYDTYINSNGHRVHINAWQTNSNGNSTNYVSGQHYTANHPMTGIITGVNYETGALEMGVNVDSETLLEPGFFTYASKSGKDIISGYKMQFSRNGDTYTLSGMTDASGTNVMPSYDADEGSNFLPLDSIRSTAAAYDSKNFSNHNFFFGLRYDIEFSIGDYNGPLNYSFTGDDDLWVVLDAKDNGGKVIIDLGGIHGAISDSVNLWEELGVTPSTISEEQRAKTHTLTILYMERGGNESNCKMQFTLPNSKVINSTVNPVDFEFTKVNSRDEVLAGATFGLYDTNNTLLKTAVSDENGKVVFANIYDGTYKVKETKAPSGYVKDTTEYTLTVLNRNAKMTASGSDVEVTSVVNYTQQEEATNNITNSKNATLIDEATRTFRLDLSASTSGETGGTEAKGASIVLVLDASSSLSNNTFASLKQGAVDFVAKIAEKSPESEIAIIWYQGGAINSSGTITDSIFYQLNTSNNLTQLNTTINSQSKSGGTPMDAALKAAYDKLGFASNENKYVVFFTDGLPGWYDPTGNGYGNSERNYNCKVANGAANYASQIKSSTGRNATIYTIGYGLDNSDYIEWTYNSDGTTTHTNHSHTTRTNGNNFLSNYIASPGKAYTTSTNDALTQIFADIAGEVSELFEVQADRIVDVIDPRFDLVTTEAELKETYGSGVSISQTADGRTQIIWTGESAKIRNEKDEEGPWTASIVVQAKPDFVGGNVIPTNGSESGIEIDGELIPFPQPSVNVKVLELGLTGTEITVYKGDIVDSTAFAKALADTLKVTKLYDENGQQISVLPVLTTEQLATLNTAGVLEVDYSYTGTTDVVGKFRFELTLDPNASNTPSTPTAGTEVVETQHAEMVSGEDVEIYRLTVSYIPDKVEERMDELTGITQPTANGGTEVTTKTATADYVVNVISGEIRITKTLKETSDVARDFTFLVQEGINDPIEVTITVPAGETSASYTGDSLKDLVRGTYTVTEKDVDGYVLDEVEILANLTNCQNSKVDVESVTFVLGNDESGANVIKAYAYDSADGGTLGSANFTNEKAYKEWSIVKRSSSNTSLFLEGAEFELKSDTNTYKGISDENGVIVWYRAGSDTPLQSMEYIVKGTYTLRETKAPEGYSLTDLTWTVTVVAKGYLKNIECSDKQFNDVSIGDNGVFTCFIENTPLYELPSTGGLGIYTYTIGGILLMAFATLILYKNRRKEVLAR